jgi:hypothetical protein
MRLEQLGKQVGAGQRAQPADNPQGFGLHCQAFIVCGKSARNEIILCVVLALTDEEGSYCYADVE